MEATEHLTVDNLPKALNGVNLAEGTYEATNQPLIAGKSLVANKCGRLYLYMAQDPRNNTQTIVWRGGDLFFLDRKLVAIRLL